MYLDTSAVVALFLRDPHGAKMQQWMKSRQQPIRISSLVIAEFSSAVARRWRMKEIDGSTVHGLIDVFDQWCVHATTILSVQDDNMKQATKYVRQLSLHIRTPDALHATLCLSHNLVLVTFDLGLAQAARTLGLTVEIPA